MIASFIMPWWIGSIREISAVTIYGWGLRLNLDALTSYIASDVTPIWQVVLAWVYVGISVGLAIYSTWLGRWKGSALLGIIGVGLIVYVIVAVHMVITNRTADFGVPLEGMRIIGETEVLYTKLQAGYNLAYIAGGILVSLAIIRGFIFGKLKS